MTTPAPLDLRASDLGYSLRRYYVDEFFTRRAPLLRGRVLDLGGVKKRKRGQFDIGRYGLNIVYANYAAAALPDVRVDAAAIPFADASFDGLICAELLEHLRRPVAALHEAARVLRPGGLLLITVPFLFRIHGDPDDYGRYTDSFWRAELIDSGFEVIEIERQGKFFSVLADFLKQYFAGTGGSGIAGRIGRRAIPHFLKWAMRHEAKTHIAGDPFVRAFATGFGIVARRRG